MKSSGHYNLHFSVEIYQEPYTDINKYRIEPDGRNFANRNFADQTFANIPLGLR
jgi:hypothetical protein